MVVINATPKLPPRFLRRLYIPVALPISSFLMPDMVMVVRGIKINLIPTPSTSLGQIMVLKSAARLKFDMR